MTIIHQFDEAAMRMIAEQVARMERLYWNLAADFRALGLKNRRAGTGKKRLVRFELSEALATSDADASATITDQYGPGRDGAASITVHNLADNTGTAYVFEGDSGDAGLAIWDSGTDYIIIQIECP